MHHLRLLLWPLTLILQIILRANLAKHAGIALHQNGPGNAPNAPGSAFNENGGIAGGVYAGNNPFAPGFVNGKANDHAVAQYDVGCYQVSQQSKVFFFF